MSDYAIKNLMEIEDGTGVEGIEGRFSRKFLDSEQLGISHFRYAPERRVTHGHRHEVQEEAYVEVIAVGGTKPEGGDGELVADRWPDADG